jgi:hypothetical protein
MDEIQIGQFSLSVILYVALGIFFKGFPNKVDGEKVSCRVTDRWKAPVAVGLGMGLGLVGMMYSSLEWTAPNVINYLVSGFLSGASAVGLYEIQRSAIRPRG